MFSRPLNGFTVNSCIDIETHSSAVDEYPHFLSSMVTIFVCFNCRSYEGLELCPRPVTGAMLKETRVTVAASGSCGRDLRDAAALQRRSPSRTTRRRIQCVCVLTGAFAFFLGFLAGSVIPALVTEPPRTTQGVYWSSTIEANLPKGFSQAEEESWRRFSRNATVVSVTDGCGRMQNRLITFQDGSKSCVRYRQNTDQIQGEIFSFYLGRELGLSNLVPTSLDLVKTRSPRWSPVLSELLLAQWAEDRPVVLTRFLPQLSPVHIPLPLRSADRRLHPPDIRNTTDLVELAQWSDLIIFDYLTANLDRVVNNLYNLQWNPAMMDAPTHNLNRAGPLLVFLDNESGLLHGYRLLHKYEAHHSALLDALCIFRRPTADAIRRLNKEGNVGKLLLDRFRVAHPDLLDVLPELPEKSVQILNRRIGRVHDVISRCESLYPEPK